MSLWNSTNNNLLVRTNISKPIVDFLIQNGIDINNIPDVFNFEVKGKSEAMKNDYNYTLTWGNLNYKNKTIATVNVKDIIGSLNPFFMESKDFLSSVSHFYNETDNYGTRSLNHLQSDLNENINNILSLEKPIQLVEENGKYYVGKDGNHRAFYLLMSYLTLKEKYKGNPEKLEKIEDKFKVKAEVMKESGYEKIDKICYCLSKNWNNDIKLDFNQDESFAFLQVNGNTYKINSEDEFVIHFNDYLASLDKNSEEYLKLDSELSKFGYPNRVAEITKSNLNVQDKTNYSHEENQNKSITQTQLNEYRQKMYDYYQKGDKEGLKRLKEELKLIRSSYEMNQEDEIVGFTK